MAHSPKDSRDTPFANPLSGARSTLAEVIHEILVTLLLDHFLYGFIALVASLFALGINDTQTGCKLFRRQALADVLPRLREQRFAFDLEFFVAARAAGIHRMAAAPVAIEARMAGSTVGRAAITRTLSDALTVLARPHFSPPYRTPAALISAGNDPAPAVVLPMPRRTDDTPLSAPAAASLPTLKAA